MSKVPKHELESILRKLSELEESVAEIKDKVRGLLEVSNVNQTVVTSPSPMTPTSPSAFNPSLNENLAKVYGSKTVVGVGSNAKASTQVQSGYGKKPSPSSGIVGARLSAFESSSEKGVSSRPPPPPIPPATFRKFSVKAQNNVRSSPVASSPVNTVSPTSVAATITGIEEKPKLLPHISVAMKNEILQRTNTSNASANSETEPEVPKQFQQRVNDSDSEADDDNEWE